MNIIVYVWIVSVIGFLSVVGNGIMSCLSFSENQKLFYTIILCTRVVMLILFIISVVSAKQSCSKTDKLKQQIIKYEQAQKQYELTQEEELALQALKQEILQGEDRSSCFILGAIFAFFMFFEIGIYRLMDGSIFKHPYLI